MHAPITEIKVGPETLKQSTLLKSIFDAGISVGCYDIYKYNIGEYVREIFKCGSFDGEHIHGH